IAVALDGPGVDDLPALLGHVAQRDEGALHAQTRLLLELAPRGGQLVLALRPLALGDRPGPEVLLRPVGTARMDEQDLEQAAAAAVHQEARAHARHQRVTSASPAGDTTRRPAAGTTAARGRAGSRAAGGPRTDRPPRRPGSAARRDGRAAWPG